MKNGKCCCFFLGKNFLFVCEQCKKKLREKLRKIHHLSQWWCIPSHSNTNYVYHKSKKENFPFGIPIYTWIQTFCHSFWVRKLLFFILPFQFSGKIMKIGTILEREENSFSVLFFPNFLFHSFVGNIIYISGQLWNAKQLRCTALGLLFLELYFFYLCLNAYWCESEVTKFGRTINAVLTQETNFPVFLFTQWIITSVEGFLVHFPPLPCEHIIFVAVTINNSASSWYFQTGQHLYFKFAEILFVSFLMW